MHLLVFMLLLGALAAIGAVGVMCALGLLVWLAGCSSDPRTPTAHFAPAWVNAAGPRTAVRGSGSATGSGPSGA